MQCPVLPKTKMRPPDILSPRKSPTLPRTTSVPIRCFEPKCEMVEQSPWINKVSGNGVTEVAGFGSSIAICFRLTSNTSPSGIVLRPWSILTFLISSNDRSERLSGETALALSCEYSRLFLVKTITTLHQFSTTPRARVFVSRNKSTSNQSGTDEMVIAKFSEQSDFRKLQWIVSVQYRFS